jgi:transposase
MRSPENAARRESARVPLGSRPRSLRQPGPQLGKKTGYLRTQFLRIKGRQGAKKAIMAVAASMLTAVYYMLRNGTPYRDLGVDHLDHRDKQQVTRRLLRHLADLGVQVEVKTAA